GPPRWGACSLRVGRWGCGGGFCRGAAGGGCFTCGGGGGGGRGGRGGAGRAFRVPGYPWTPGLFVLAALYVVASSILANPRNALIGAGLLALGVPVYLLAARYSGRGVV